MHPSNRLYCIPPDNSTTSSISVEDQEDYYEEMDDIFEEFFNDDPFDEIEKLEV